MRSNKTTNPVAQLGEAVKAYRKSMRLTQKELGSYAGCGALFIHELEHGKETIRLNKLLDVLKVLGLQLTLEPGKSEIVIKGRDS